MKNKVFLIAVIAVIAVVIGCLIVGVILRGDRKEPSDTPITEPTADTDTGDVIDVQPITDDDKSKTDKISGDACIDVLEEGKKHEKNPKIEVDGDVVIIAGVKEDGE